MMYGSLHLIACLHVLEDELFKLRICADNCIFVVEAEFALAHFKEPGSRLGKIAIGLFIRKLHDGGEDLNWEDAFSGTLDALICCCVEEMHHGYEA